MNRDGADPQGREREGWVAEAEATPAVSEETAVAVGEFGFDLYAALRDSADANLIVSPLSVSTALGMLLVGAVDAAREELLAVLHLPDVQQAHAGLAGLTDALHERDSSDGITVAIANRSFIQDGYPIRPEFLNTLGRWYGDAMAAVDYSTDPEGARAIINRWVAERTNELIDELLQPGSVDTLTRLVLVNAVYLLAEWNQQFDKDRTRDEPFHLADGTKVDVPMMNDTRTVQVAVGEDYRAVELPYVDGKLAMLIVIPDDLADFERGLSAERINAIIAELARREAALWLPRVETRTHAALTGTLQTLGIRRVFEPDAGWLTAIADDRSLHVSDVIHETYLRMDEEGTEAAAATAVVIRTTSLGPPPVEIRADRPYFLVLRDRPTGAILFMGRIVDPR